MGYRKQMEWLKDNHFEIVIKHVDISIAKEEEAETVGSKLHYETETISATIEVGGIDYEIEIINSDVKKSEYDGETFEINEDFVYKRTKATLNGEDLGENTDRKIIGGDLSFIKGGVEFKRNLGESWAKLSDKLRAQFEKTELYGREQKPAEDITEEAFYNASSVLAYIQDPTGIEEHAIDLSKHDDFIKSIRSSEYISSESIKRFKGLGQIFDVALSALYEKIEAIEIFNPEKAKSDLEQMEKELSVMKKDLISDFERYGAVDEEIKDGIFEIAKIYQSAIMGSLDVYGELKDIPKTIRKLARKEDLTADDFESVFSDSNEAMNHAYSEKEYSYESVVNPKIDFEQASALLQAMMDSFSNSKVDVAQWKDERSIKLRTLPEPLFDVAIKEFDLSDRELELQSDLNIALSNAPNPLRFIKSLSMMSSHAQDNMVYFAMKKDPEDIKRILDREVRVPRSELAVG